MFKDVMGIGGIFHSAVQVYGDVEWSFGFGKDGSGVFRSPAGKNSEYTHYESIVLGETDISKNEVNDILVELSSWINRFANAGGAATKTVVNTSSWIRGAVSGTVSASKVASECMLCNDSNSDNSESEDDSE
ncbi:hypothetical protein SAY86_017081 [Trapa natans]|uniref:PPPDE domain-containing protein n=1 Tax=Trapa natans TaxID=22666 RepID=A0AAN7LPU2_TRANT|nr:hypothetical protein SAY86_017081 [Trapa natans]